MVNLETNKFAYNWNQASRISSNQNQVTQIKPLIQPILTLVSRDPLTISSSI